MYYIPSGRGLDEEDKRMLKEIRENSKSDLQKEKEKNDKTVGMLYSKIDELQSKHRHMQKLFSKLLTEDIFNFIVVDNQVFDYQSGTDCLNIIPDVKVIYASREAILKNTFTDEEIEQIIKYNKDVKECELI